MTESHSNSDVQEVEQTDSEEATIMVADPDDYQKSKKLKAIHESKKGVREVLQNKHEILNEVSRQKRDHWRSRFSDSIAMYGLELMPLIEEAKRKDVLDDSDLVVGHPSMETDIETFVHSGGAIHDSDGPRSPKQWEGMNYYQQLQRIERKLGFGLDLEEEQTPAEI